MAKSSDHIKDLFRRETLRETRLQLTYDEDGVTFDIRVQTSDAFIKAFVTITHGDMAEKFGQWFASRPKEIQEGVIAMLQRHMEKEQ